MPKATILICDDEEGVRESLKHMLGDEYVLSYAADGAEAVAFVKAHDPDLAILDVKMPKINGLEALRQIKSAKPHVKVLMITGYDSTDIAAQAINLGAADYLVKPFKQLAILAQINAALGAGAA